MERPAKAVICGSAGLDPSPSASGSTTRPRHKWYVPRIRYSMPCSVHPESDTSRAAIRGTLFTVFTITFSTVFIADMPAGHMRIVPVTLARLIRAIKLLKHENWACIVALTEFVMSSLVIRSRYFRISFIIHAGSAPVELSTIS